MTVTVLCTCLRAQRAQLGAWMFGKRTLALAIVTASLLMTAWLSGDALSTLWYADVQEALDLIERSSKRDLAVDEYQMRQRQVYVRASQPSERMIETNWFRGNDSDFRFEQRHAVTGELIVLMQRTSGEMRLYDPRRNVDIVYSIKPPQLGAPPIVDRRPDSVARLATSDWGRPALLLRFYNDLRGEENRESRQRMQEDYRLPDIVALQAEKVIDQASGHDVRFEWWAVTSRSQRILLQRVMHEPPRNGKLSEIPADWFDIPANVKRVP